MPSDVKSRIEIADHEMPGGTFRIRGRTEGGGWHGRVKTSQTEWKGTWETCTNGLRLDDSEDACLVSVVVNVPEISVLEVVRMTRDDVESVFLGDRKKMAGMLKEAFDDHSKCRDSTIHLLGIAEMAPKARSPDS